MWDRLFDFTKRLATLSDELDQNRQELKEVRQEPHQLSLVVRELQAELRHNREMDQLSRKNLVLELNQVLNTFHQRLPSEEK